MEVVARFVCNSVTETVYNKNAQLSAVYGKEGVNADFAKATPSGNLQIGIDNDTKASTMFKPGKTYELVFRELPEEA